MSVIGKKSSCIKFNLGKFNFEAKEKYELVRQLNILDMRIQLARIEVAIA